jgi:hypothetical protein
MAWSYRQTARKVLKKPTGGGKERSLIQENRNSGQESSPFQEHNFSSLMGNDSPLQRYDVFSGRKNEKKGSMLPCFAYFKP